MMEHSDLYLEKLEWRWNIQWAMEKGYTYSIPDEPQEEANNYEVQFA